MNHSKNDIQRFTDTARKAAPDFSARNKLVGKILSAFPALDLNQHPELYEAVYNFYQQQRDTPQSINIIAFKAQLENKFELALMEQGGRGPYPAFEKKINAFMNDIIHYAAYNAAKVVSPETALF